MSVEASSIDNDLEDANQSVTISENSVFSDVLTKLRSLQDNSKKKEYRQDILNNGAKYLAELILIIEDDKHNAMSHETALSIEDGLKTFLKTIDNINIEALFQNDSTFAYQTFHLYLNLFDLPGMKNYLKRAHMQTFLDVLYTAFITVTLQIVTLTLMFCKLTVADLKQPLDHQDSLILMFDFMKGELEPDSSFTYSTITELILMFLWNYSDKTVIVPNLIKVGCPETVIKWLLFANRPRDVTSPFNFAGLHALVNKSKSDTIQRLIRMIHNVSRHDDGINILNSLDANNVIKNVQSDTEDSITTILCCMILALLSTPEQSKHDRKCINNVLDQLLQSVSNASKTKEYKNDGFHISEPLVVLVKLLNDDRALEYILQHAQVELDAASTVEFFIHLLRNFLENVSSEKDPLKPVTCTALVNILWSISFQEHYQYKRQLKTNQYLMNFLENLPTMNEMNDDTANSPEYIPKYIENIQTAARGILLNVNQTTSSRSTDNHPMPSSLQLLSKRQSVVDALIPRPLEGECPVVDNNSKPIIMISYSHDDKMLCYQLEEELKRNEQFELWIDKDFCTTGDSWDHIARGIKQSHVVLCLITKNYTSKSVRREVIYAIDRLDKPLLPVFVLKPNLPEWLDSRTCDLTHVRFTDEKQLDRLNISTLIETLHKLVSRPIKGEGSASAHYAPVVPPLQALNEETNEYRNQLSTDIHTRSTLLQKPVDQWNKDDIKEWCQENGILLELYELYQFVDGSELLSYAKVLAGDEKTHYKTYAEEFQKLYADKTLLLHQFNKLCNALQKLLDKNDQRTLSDKPLNHTAPTKSQTCQIL